MLLLSPVGFAASDLPEGVKKRSLVSWDMRPKDILLLIELWSLKGKILNLGNVQLPFSWINA